MKGGTSSGISVNEFPNEGHAESSNDFVIKSQIKIVKVGKQLNVYVSNFTDDQKLQNKNNLCIYFKRKLFQVKEFSFYFWFKKGARFKFVSLC